MPPVALSVGETILLITLVAIPVAALAFIVGARNALGQIGRGPLSIDQEPRASRPGSAAPISRETHAAEVRQMLEAKAYRRRRRGGGDLDVDAEVDRLLSPGRPGGSPPADPELAAEVRGLVLAANDRRRRRGEPPLDVDAEVARRLAELGGLDG
ncbi:MAG TPA: hypothetical protein VK919_09305 [Solirubrobacterales bacterium]|nr:hypothetical protein [Solirubrobacterales bacterium]